MPRGIHPTTTFRLAWVFVLAMAAVVRMSPCAATTASLTAAAAGTSESIAASSPTSTTTEVPVRKEPSTARPTSPSTTVSSPTALHLAYVKKATWEETCVASLAASSVTAPVLGDWFYIGPFDNPGGRGFGIVYLPEKELALDKTYEGKSGRLVRWKRGDRLVDGRVNDLLPFFEDKTNAVAYLYRVIYCPADMERVASFGSDDTLTVWLNGLKVLSKNVARAAEPDSDRATVKLREGQNELLLKICQGAGGWGFYFSMDTKVPRSVELPLLAHLIEDFPADPKVNAAYERLFELRHAPAPRAEAVAADIAGVNVKEFGASGVGGMTNGNIDAGSRLVTNVGDTKTFRAGDGIYLWHFKPVDGVAAVDIGRSDCVASVRIRPGPAGNPSEGGLAFRVSEAKNYWALSATFAGAGAPVARVRLIQVRDGSPTELRAKDVERPTSPTAALALKVVLTGERIQALVNDRALFDLADRFNTGTRKVGLYESAGHQAGSPIWLQFRVDSQVEDDFDRSDNRYDLGATRNGQKWESVAGRWGIVDGSAQRTEGAAGEKLSSVVVAVRRNELDLAHPWSGENNSLVEIYHDDTAAIERALGATGPESVGLARHLIFPEGGYNISRPLRLGPYVKLTGWSVVGGIGAWISALPGFAPEYDEETFILYWLFANGSNAADNRQQSLENLRLGSIQPATNPGLSGVRLATGPGSRYVNVEVDASRRGIVIAAGSADSLFETIGVRAGETCIDLLGPGTRSLTFRNLTLSLYDIGKAAVGMRLRSGTAGVIAQAVSCSGLARPVLIQGGSDIALMGLNAGGRPDYPVVEVERAPDDLSLMLSGMARGFQKALTIGGETVVWVRSPGGSPDGAGAFRFIGGQSSFWMGASDGGRPINYFDHVSSPQEIRGGESFIVDLIQTRARGGGSAIYDYVASTGGTGGTVEVGTLTVLHNRQDFQVVRTVKGRVGPDAAQSLFTPDAEMLDGLLTLRVKADVPLDRSIWFNAVKTGLGVPGVGQVGNLSPEVERAVNPSSQPTVAQTAPLSTRPGADGYIRDWLVIGPVPLKGDTPRGVLATEDLEKEGSIRPRPGQRTIIRGEVLHWTAAHSNEPSLDVGQVVNLSQADAATSPSFAYVVAYLEADRDIPGLTLRLDFDGAVRLWFNGNEVTLAADGPDPAVGEKPLAHHGAASGLTLLRGENLLVLKACHETGRWAVGLRFKNPAGQPVRDYRVTTKAKDER